MAEPRTEGLVNHLPDEVCVRVRAPASTSAERLYDQVRSSVNRYLQQPPTNFRDLHPPLVRDIEPRELVSSRVSEVLHPLRGPRAVPILFGSDIWHCYYGVEPAMQRVREVTNLLNLAALGQADRPN